MNRIFTAAADLSRLNPAGIVLMVCALALAALSGILAERTGITKSTLKLIALLICAGGALLAII